MKYSLNYDLSQTNITAVKYKEQRKAIPCMLSKHWSSAQRKLKYFCVYMFKFASNLSKTEATCSLPWGKEDDIVVCQTILIPQVSCE